jgi:hypothetical protein
MRRHGLGLRSAHRPAVVDYREGVPLRCAGSALPGLQSCRRKSSASPPPDRSACRPRSQAGLAALVSAARPRHSPIGRGCGFCALCNRYKRIVLGRGRPFAFTPVAVTFRAAGEWPPLFHEPAQTTTVTRSVILSASPHRRYLLAVALGLRFNASLRSLRRIGIGMGCKTGRRGGAQTSAPVGHKFTLPCFGYQPILC